ncbi:MAG: 2Fe-2S iron-sulfur cluster binding domain-containing protein [Alcanivoracaceae bacterium]|nr:2Fe-2S iron-sulfur cluster binding domain-containing protein [Alcanivoracaceae bacterium]
MKIIKFGDNSFECKDGENLLDAFFRNKIDTPFSCRNGTCQACIIQSVTGEITRDSQVGLSQHLIASRHLLPCKCYPVSDMELKAASVKDIYSMAKMTEIKSLSAHIKSVSIKPCGGLSPYKAGQFINIRTNLDNKVRSYSLSSQYENHEAMTFHVQKISAGTFSSWIFEGAKVDDEIQVYYPLGACHSSNNNNVSGKLIMATGSGLGAAFAIARQELELGYTQGVYLYHASKNDTGLYMIDELKALKDKYRYFKYTLSVSEEESNRDDVIFAKVEELAFDQLKTLKNWEVYLYGNPGMVKVAIELALSKGCEGGNIYSDAFEYAKSAQYNRTATETDKMELIEEEKRQFEPDAKMWKALKSGERLKQILHDFYDKVLVDPLLSPFFKGVTKSHIVGKQYAFLNQVYTGKDCYFGDRPRNAHHWMVISDSLFDHREKLFADSCIKCGLEEPFLSQILAFDESYRQTMVKTKVWPRITDGEIKPIKGFEEMILDIGSICDGCEKELEPGYNVHYHDRTGEMFCEECNNN